MANWTEVSEGDFHAHLKKQGAKGKLRAESLMRGTLTVYYIGADDGSGDYRDHQWIAKRETLGRDRSFYIAEL
jgi:hypothetical protein